ncbi:MAG TPA: hypothetical protein VHM91_04450, partial [Verrucomicrobiales bacterium]|nr:hypothetical protein [Verrucomicrobiales bacterium]
MPDASPSPAVPVSRRKRRWLRRLLWGFGLTLGLLWLVKVPLLNWGLRRVPGDFEISITGVSPGWSSAALTGVKVVHRPTGRLLAYAVSLEVRNGWMSLFKGDLGTLNLSKADVNWHPEFASQVPEPVVAGPPASPLLTWETGEVRDSIFSWYERGHEVPRLSLKITSLKGGRMTLYNDGRVEALGQMAVLDDLVSREYAMGGSLEIETRSPHAEGIITAQRKENQFAVKALKLSAPELKMVWRRGESLPAVPPDVPGPPRPAWDKPALFLIEDGLADPGRVMFTIHSPNAAPVEFSGALSRVYTAGLRAGGGLPCIIPLGEATFAGMKSPGAKVEAQEVSFSASLDEQTRIHVAAATVNGATVTDSNRLLTSLGFTVDELKTVPVCSGGLDAKCANLLIGREGLHSTEPQQIVLKNFSAVMPGKKEPVASAPQMEVSAVPDEAFTQRRVRSVVVDRMNLTIDKSELPPVASQRPPASSSPGAPPPPVSVKPEWFGWHTDSLTVKTGNLKATGLGFGVPNAMGTFSVKTEPREPAGESFYRVHVNDIALENPLLPAAPFKSKGTMDVDIHPLRFWEKGEVDQILIDREKVELNDVFLKLFSTGDKEPPKKETPGAAEVPAGASSSSFLPPLNVRRLVITDSEVAVDNIGDGRRLVIPIPKQTFENVPLTGEIRDNDAAHAIQKVEVPAIYLYAPFNEGQTVAELPTNFIYFSFAGLLQRRIERVDLVSPKIKAGQPLFDFIDVMRTRFSSETAAAPKFMPLLAARDSSSLPVQLALQALKSAGTKGPVWDVPFFAEYGSVITAPKGLEWTQIPPLPFRNARVREGPDKGKVIPFRLRGDEVHGELAIVPGWYDFPDYKLRIYMSDEGRIVFNFPLKDKDNNLVEVFRNNKVLYRQLMIEKVWLSVTYDKAGIYVGFGGESCGGYITGKVNLYLDEVYSWDSTASFTGVRMKDLTKKLTHEYVLIDGTVDSLNVTAYGDMNGLYQSTAALKMSRPGRMQWKCLDEWRDKYVKGRKDWTDDAARISLDLLRDFSFTSCEGSARLFGQEGKVQLKLKGRDGSQEYNVKLHD